VAGLRRFADWPVPVLLVAGNHEYDDRDLAIAVPALRDHVAGFGIRMLECETTILQDGAGRRVRFVGCTRWSDFDGVGVARREKAMRAGSYFQRVMNAMLDGAPFDAAAVRTLALSSRAWLEGELAKPGAVRRMAGTARSSSPTSHRARGATTRDMACRRRPPRSSTRTTTSCRARRSGSTAICTAGTTGGTGDAASSPTREVTGPEARPRAGTALFPSTSRPFPRA
jgi:hypothetical protein